MIFLIGMKKKKKRKKKPCTGQRSWTPVSNREWMKKTEVRF